MGGEKVFDDAYIDFYYGSPPRGRGKDSGTVHGCGQLRITPAWAGKSSCLQLLSGMPWDHPRVGGEKKRRALSVSAFLGSPPRGRGKANKAMNEISKAGSPPHGRGKVVLRQVAGAPAGITPAWAGKSICLALPITAPRDHPRVGGEKTRVFQQHFPAVGSPPHGRGKGAGLHALLPETRITPAWAGKRLTRPAMTGTPRDHPRVGGEKIRQSIWYSTT